MAAAAKSKIDTVHFPITGELLTRHVRDRVLSEDHEGAIRVLETLDEFPLDAVRKVLMGQAEFTGINSLELVESDPEDEAVQSYLNDLHFIYGKAFYWAPAREWLQPYCRIISFGREDYTEAEEARLDGRAHRLIKFPKPRYAHQDPTTGVIDGVDNTVHLRGFHYVDNKYSDWLLMEDEQVYGCKPVKAPPYWYLEHANEITFDQAMEHYIGPDRGHKDKYYDQYIVDEDYDRMSALECRTAGMPTLTKNPVDKILEEVREEIDLEKQYSYEESLKKMQKELHERTQGMPTVTLESEEGDYTAEVPRVLLDAYVDARLHKSSMGVAGGMFLPYICSWWSSTAPSGMKLYNDNPYHTDILLYVNGDTGDYEDPLNRLIEQYEYKLRKESTKNIPCVIHANTTKQKSVMGYIYEYSEGVTYPKDSILLIPTAHPKYDILIDQYRAVITKVGGRNCHLAIVSREKGRVFVQSEYEFKTGQHVDIDLVNAEIRLIPRAI